MYEYRCVLCGHLLKTAKSWEHTRLLAYVQFKANSSKKVSLTEFMPLLTDPLEIEKPQVSKEDKQKLFEQGQERLKMVKLVEINS